MVHSGLTNPELESSSHPEERSGHIGEEIDNHQDENNRTNTENYANTFERIMTMNNTRLQERQWRELREAMERLREEFTVDEVKTDDIFLFNTCMLSFPVLSAQHLND